MLSAAARTDHRLAPRGAAGVPWRALPPQRGPRECAVTRSARLRCALPQGTAVRQATAPWFRVECLTRPPRVGAFIEWRPHGGAPTAAGAPSSTRLNTRKVAALRAGRSCRWDRSRSRAAAGTAADECGSGREEAPPPRARQSHGLGAAQDSRARTLVGDQAILRVIHNAFLFVPAITGTAGPGGKASNPAPGDDLQPPPTNPRAALP